MKSLLLCVAHEDMGGDYMHCSEHLLDPISGTEKGRGM